MTQFPDEILPGLFLWQSGLAGAQQPVNSYIWSAPQGVVLIDPAGDLAPQVIDRLGAGEVTDIFITHLQEEHVAGCRNFPNASVHIPAGDEYLCEGLKAYEAMITTWPPPWEWETRGNFKGHLAGARNERPLQERLYVFETLKDGEEIKGLTVLATPGHGKNAVTLLAEINGYCVAFCGDLICGDGQLWNWFDCEWDYGLETGQRTLRDSAVRLLNQEAQLLCPAHGPIVHTPHAALAKLIVRVEASLSEPVTYAPLNVQEKESPARGWRELLPNLHQWRTGNCAALISRTGNALLVDDGLCHWVPLQERAAHHRKVISDLKRTLSIKKIDMIIPTHYHGDHIENIPDLVAMEGTEVVSLDVVAGVMERPEQFNLASMMPWYGTSHDSVVVDRKVPDKSRLRWHEFELEIFHLGGQTFYHVGIGVTIEDKRVLFVGDAIVGWHVAPEPVVCYNDNEPQSRGWAYSIERMMERCPDLLVCGHGAAIRDPMLLLEAKRIAWHERMENFKALSARKDLRLFFDPYL